MDCEIACGQGKSSSNDFTISFLFVTSSDESKGISDDYFLLRALRRRNIPFQHILWTDHTCMLDNDKSKKSRQVVIIRSLWEGSSRLGTSTELVQYFSQVAEICPQMKHDYQLLHWIIHKSYLLILQEAGVDIIPTRLIPPSSGKQGNALSVPYSSIEPSPGGLKRAMIALGWSVAVLKPAVGSRCEGVIRLSLENWSLTMAFKAAALLREGDCLLQPFLPSVACSTYSVASRAADQMDANHLKKVRISGPETNRNSTGLRSDDDKDIMLLGEVCVLCVNGKVVHAVHKHPALWGWHEDTCECSSETDFVLESATCTCTASQRPHKVTSNIISFSTGRNSPDKEENKEEEKEEEPEFPKDVIRFLQRAPVDCIALPLPFEIVASVGRVMELIRSTSDGQVPFMCRLDFLPRLRAAPCKSDSTASSVAPPEAPPEAEQGEGEGEVQWELEWLFSEMEGQWCEGFFREAPTSVLDLVLEAALHRATQ